MSKALRHDPAAAGLTLDSGGWVPVAEVLVALRVDRASFDQMVATNDKKRFAVETGSDGIGSANGVWLTEAVPPQCGTVVESGPTVRQ